MADSSDIFDLDAFEADLASGALDSLVAKLKTKPVQQKAKPSFLKSKVEKVLDQVPVVKLDLPTPTAVVYYYKQFQCDSCGQTTELLAQRLVRLEQGKKTYMKPIITGINDAEIKANSGLPLCKIVAVEKVIACSFCCDKNKFDSIPEVKEYFTTQRD